MITEEAAGSKRLQFPEWLRNVLAGLGLLFLFSGLISALGAGSLIGGVLIVGAAVCLGLLTSPGRAWRRVKAPGLKGGMLLTGCLILLFAGAGFIGTKAPIAPAKKVEAKAEAKLAAPVPVQAAPEPQPTTASANEANVDAPAAPSEATLRHVERVIALWKRLDQCRHDSRFKIYGLSPVGPCGNFVEVATDWSSNANEQTLPAAGFTCSATEVHVAGLAAIHPDADNQKLLRWTGEHVRDCETKLKVLMPGQAVDKATFTGVWPLTVSSGHIGCDYNGAVWFQPTGSVKRYAINGTARNKYPGIEPIWSKETNPNTGALRINITDLLQAARNVCPNR